MKSTEKVTDWNKIYNQMFQKRAVDRFNYDCTHGIGAFDRREKEQLKELHKFFVNIEKESDNNARRPVIYI
ncbi:hypothetical protein LDX54_08940 [Lactobacillus sp. IBH004]|uniref:hypothetical protein n=1 Tax=Lactobacillus sp. IBH004 TaxID=2879107 RepID=UPI002242D7F3|nr:hypothetical protein [Lactobacillus sp. IBH004]UZN41864.1 hypothetical protein LDX54_08940 [Lactobacillus sp. IBH004]